MFSCFVYRIPLRFFNRCAGIGANHPNVLCWLERSYCKQASYSSTNASLAKAKQLSYLHPPSLNVRTCFQRTLRYTMFCDASLLFFFGTSLMTYVRAIGFDLDGARFRLLPVNEVRICNAERSVAWPPSSSPSPCASHGRSLGN